MNILQITVILVVSTGFGDDRFFGGGGGGGMVVASMYPASRIVVTFEYGFCLMNYNQDGHRNYQKLVDTLKYLFTSYLIWIAFSKLMPKFECGFCILNDNQDG